MHILFPHPDNIRDRWKSRCKRRARLRLRLRGSGFLSRMSRVRRARGDGVLRPCLSYFEVLTRDGVARGLSGR
jgi:hypothetical protein